MVDNPKVFNFAAYKQVVNRKVKQVKYQAIRNFSTG
jgi:hypothetical protein